MSGDRIKTDILGVSFDVVTREEALTKALSLLDGDLPKTMYTPNPEFVMLARKNAEFRGVLNRGDMLIPDGIGIVIASKFNRVKIKERVAGYDLLQEIFGKIKNTGRTVYFFGGKPGIAELAKEKMIEKHPGLKIIGVSDGYYDETKEREIIAEINRLEPDIILVGTGFPRQETWIENNKGKLPCKLLIGVGGSFDGMNGNVKRAPVIFQKMGLEWFYRLIKQPSRFRRQLELPKFMLIVICASITRRFRT